jgi:hypothetical protein
VTRHELWQIGIDHPQDGQRSFDWSEARQHFSLAVVPPKDSVVWNVARDNLDQASAARAASAAFGRQRFSATECGVENGFPFIHHQGSA